MFQLKCDDYILYDPRDERLIIGDDATVDLETNKAGSMSFSLYHNHPYYNYPQKLKSIFTLKESSQTIFRGIMVNDPKDWLNTKVVNLQGVLTFLNNSVIKPFVFPDDFIEDAGYISASETGNVVEFLLRWFIECHNAQVQEHQRFFLGKVTVTDPNNYISRSSESYTTTWKLISDKLFNSTLGGKLCIRYEDDGNYIDYLSSFELTNTQEIKYGENLIDLSTNSDASELYTAILPIGAEIVVSTTEDGEEIKERVTIENLPDGTLDTDIVKSGSVLYSIAAVEKYGYICKPVEFNDVTISTNLQAKSKELLEGTGVKLSNTIEINAYDLHYSDSQIASFRINRKVNFDSTPHKLSGVFDLTKIKLPILKLQNAKFTLGQTVKSLSDFNSDRDRHNTEKIETAIKDIAENRTEISEVRHQQVIQETKIINDCQKIILEASEQFISTGNFEEYKESVAAALEVMSNQISLNFNSTQSEINNVNGDLQAQITLLSKYFDFRLDGLTIKTGNGLEMQLSLDNDIISFKKNGVQFGWWDGIDFHTGNIIVDVNERAQFGNFAFIPRSDGSLSFLKVGG